MGIHLEKEFEKIECEKMEFKKIESQSSNLDLEPKIINLKDIRKSFGSLKVLKGIDFSVSKGEIVTIIGSSGSGKSTLLRCINQLEKVDSGDIQILDTHLTYKESNKTKYIPDKEIRKIIKRDLHLPWTLSLLVKF